MLLKALVIDTNSFKYNGRIRVRAVSKYFAPMKWDLAQNPEFIKEGERIIEDNGMSFTDNNDIEALVFTPFGVGMNNSLFCLPRVNSVGVIAPIGAIGSSEYVWMGGFFDGRISEDGKGTINIPSDQSNDKLDYGIENGDYLIDRENSIILRTKSTKLPEDASKINSNISWFDWKQRNTENLFVANDYRISADHFIEYEGKIPKKAQRFFMGTEIAFDDKRKITEGDNKIVLEQFTIKDGSKEEKSIEINDNEIVLFYEGNNAKNTIGLKKNEIILSTSIDNKDIEYRQTKNGVTLKYGETSISLSENTLSINAKNTVYISAPEVRLGNTDQRIVTSTSMLSGFKTVDGLILSTSKVGYA